VRVLFHPDTHSSAGLPRRRLPFISRNAKIPADPRSRSTDEALDLESTNRSPLIRLSVLASLAACLAEQCSGQ